MNKNVGGKNFGESTDLSHWLKIFGKFSYQDRNIWQIHQLIVHISITSYLANFYKLQLLVNRHVLLIALHYLVVDSMVGVIINIEVFRKILLRTMSSYASVKLGTLVIHIL